MKKLQDEIKEFKSKGDIYNKDTLNDMTYLNMCIKEALRIDPPTALSPYTVRTTFQAQGKYRKYTIPKGYKFKANPFVI